jgi:hypothetical protein
MIGQEAVQYEVDDARNGGIAFGFIPAQLPIRIERHGRNYDSRIAQCEAGIRESM